MWFGWLISRLYTFPLALWYGGYVIPYSKIDSWSGSDEAKLSAILFAFNSMLLLLNIWWFYLITIMIYRFATTGSTTDIQNKVELRDCNDDGIKKSK